MSRVLLQICTVVLSLVPIFTGIISMLGFLLLEIVGAPWFIYWQSRVAQSAIAQ